MWIKGAAQDQKTLFAEGSSSSNTPIDNFQSGTGSTTDNARLAYRGNGNSIIIKSSTGSAYDDTWHHLVLTDYAGTVLVYIDGVYDSSLSCSPDGSGTTLNKTALGVLLRSGIFGYHTGLVDEVAIFDRALTAEEAGQLAGGLDPTAIPDEGPPPPTPIPLDFRISSDATDVIFTWNSEAGKLCNLKPSMNLSANPSTWHLLESGIAATAPLNTKTIPLPDDPRRFYVLEDTSNTIFGLWSGATIPSNHTAIPFPNLMETYTLLDAQDPYEYKFLHGAAIINFKGTFYANWANSPLNENYPDEKLRERRFTDASNTGTWSTVEDVGGELPGNDRRSHASYLEHEGQLRPLPLVLARGRPPEPGLITCGRQRSSSMKQLEVGNPRVS